MNNLKEVIDKYTSVDDDLVSDFRTTVSLTARVDLATQLKLEIISSLFGRKRTPLLAEIVEASVNEIYERIEVPDEVHEDFVYKLKQAGLLD